MHLSQKMFCFYKKHVIDSEAKFCFCCGQSLGYTPSVSNEILVLIFKIIPVRFL